MQSDDSQSKHNDESSQVEHTNGLYIVKRHMCMYMETLKRCHVLTPCICIPSQINICLWRKLFYWVVCDLGQTFTYSSWGPSINNHILWSSSIWTWHLHACCTRVIQQICWGAHELHAGAWYAQYHNSILDPHQWCTCKVNYSRIMYHVLCANCMHTWTPLNHCSTSNTPWHTQCTDIARAWITSVRTIQLPRQLQPVLSSVVTTISM